MSSFPVRYIVFDCETNQVRDRDILSEADLTLDLGVMKICEVKPEGDIVSSYVDFQTTGEFHAAIAAMPKRRDKIWVFAHNIGVDLRWVDFGGSLAKGHYLLWHPDRPPHDPRFTEPKFVMEDPPTIIRCWRPDGQELQFSDTWQWLTMGLKQIGENMGFEKGKMPDRDAPKAEWWDYCRRDVDVLDRAMRDIWRWLQSQGIKAFYATRAGQSRMIYRNKYECRRIKYPDDPAALYLDRHAYYGGMTELFQVGRVEGPVYQLDINSLFPAVMAKNWYPCQVEAFDHRDDVSTIPSKYLSASTTAEVYLDSPDRGYPVKNREGTWHCRGKVRTILCGPELVEALRRGHVVRLGRWTTYKRSTLFDRFVGDFYTMRREAKARGDKVSDMIIKLLMNSLYGKFGQQTPVWRYHSATGRAKAYEDGFWCDPESDQTGVTREVAGHLWVATDRQESPDSFIPIAAYVTSYARVFMNKMREIAGEGNYFYQATDSLYVDTAGYYCLKDRKLIDDDWLGKFKVEGVYDACNFRNIHCIDKDEEQVRGSVKNNAVEVCPDTYSLVQWESFATALTRGCTDRVTLKKVLKVLNPTYRRQQVLKDGRCRPWCIDNWDLPPEVQRKLPVPVVSGG